MAKRAAKASGKIEEMIEQVVEMAEAAIEESLAADPAAAEPPKRGRGRPRKEKPTNGPTAEQEAETLAELIRLGTESASLASQTATVLNRFEKWGGSKKEIKATKALLMLDAREAQSSLERLVRYAANAGIKVEWDDDTGQGSLTEMLAAPVKNTEGTRDLAAARAHADGFNSGRNGAAPSDNPFAHKPGSEEYVAWHDGRDEGQRAREAKFGLTDRIAGAATADVSLPADKLIKVPF